MTSHRPHIGIALMIAGTLCVASGWACVKLVGSRLPTGEIVFFRSLVGFIVLAPLTYIRTGTLWGRNKFLLTLRGILGFIGMMLSFYAMVTMALGDVSMLLNTYPLFVALLAPFFLKEPSTPVTFILAAIAFIGVGMILKPTIAIFHDVALMGLGAGIAAAFAMMAIRKLHITDTTWTIAVWFSAVIALASLPLALAEFIVPSPLDMAILIVLGLILTASQLLVTKAFQYAPAAIIAPFSYLSVMWSYGFDILLWSHMPDFWSALGSVIVIASGVGIIASSRRPLVRPGATS